jgi:hypothetical protein
MVLKPFHAGASFTTERMLRDLPISGRVLD